MNSKTISTITLFIPVSLSSLLFVLWLCDFSPLNLPEVIPGLQVRTYGVLMLISFVLLFIFLQKRMLKSDTKTSVLTLIIASTSVSFISLLLYQAIRQLIVLRGQYSYDLFSVLQSSAVPTIPLILIAASISLEFKRVKGIWRHVPTALLVILFLLTKEYLHQFEW